MYVPRLDRKWSNFPPCAGLVQLLTCLSEQFCKHYHGLGASSLTERLNSRWVWISARGAYKSLAKPYDNCDFSAKKKKKE